MMVYLWLALSFNLAGQRNCNPEALSLLFECRICINILCGVDARVTARL
jgi:hypothetical protein